VRIIIIVISRLRRRDGNFVDEFHARSRGIRERNWARWLFGRGDWRVRGGREGTNRWRRNLRISWRLVRNEGNEGFYQRGCKGTWR